MTTETWVTALTGLVGLVAAVAAPVLRLNSAITRLSTLIDRALQDMGELKAAQAQLEQRATESQNDLRPEDRPNQGQAPRPREQALPAGDTQGKGDMR